MIAVILVQRILEPRSVAVVGVSSVRPNVSNFLMALVESLVPLSAKALACTFTRRLPLMVSGNDQVLEVAFGLATIVLIVLDEPQVVRLSWR